MKKYKNLFINTLSLTACVFTNTSFGQHTQSNQNPTVSFTENKGQIHDQNYNPSTDVLYGAMAGNMAFHLKTTGVSYQLYRVDKYKEVMDEKTKQSRKEIDQQTIYRIDLNWMNCNNNFVKTEDEVLPGYNNYYLESCPNGALNVKIYKGVTLHNLYKGIDLHYYEKKGELKHDYIVAPHTDYKQIQLEVKGAEISSNEDGSLILNTPLGKIQEAAPIVYQNGKQLSARWINKNNVLSFEIENYDSNLEIIIDPVTRLWGTYYGGVSDDRVNGCTSDSNNNLYVAGYFGSGSGTIIATSGSHQSSIGGFSDAALIKFNSSGLRQWATYYGGSGGEEGRACVVDVSGNVYMAGNTSSGSGTVISTSGSHQQTYGGSNDAFLVKFNSNGVRQWGTYYGGSNTETGSSCATDINGDVYLAGASNSSNANSISTLGSHQPAPGNGGDAFLVKFNSSGVRQWGTYYGGTGQEWGYSCATDFSGNIYLAGTTYTSSSAIATSSSHQVNYGGGMFDGYLVKFNTNGVRLWSTYYGGNGDDYGYSCSTDALNNIYLSGYSASSSGTAIASVSGYQSANNGGTYDAYLAKFDASGIRLWATYYGGTSEERGLSCFSDANNDVYLAGFTGSSSGTLIASAASHQPLFGGGTLDGFLVKFNSVGARQWGTYYGGTGEDRAYSGVVDNSGSLYLGGYTDSNTGTAIATLGSHQSTYGGGQFDAFLAKFDICEAAPLQASAISGTTSICSGAGATTYSIITVQGATSYNWTLPAGWAGTNNTNVIMPTPGISGQIVVTASNACGVSPQQILNVTVNPLPNVIASTTSSLLCIGESATLTANGASSYTFNPGGTGNSIIISPTATSNYTLTGSDNNGCKNSSVFTQSVEVCIGIKESNKTNSNIKLYPNPNHGVVNIELNSEYAIVIFNTVGQMVYKSKLGSGIHQINLEHLIPGIYLINLNSDSDSKSFKIIKE